MAANPSKTRIPPQSLTDLSGVGWRWIRRKAYFWSGYVPLDPGDHMMSEKLLVDVDVDMFASENRCFAIWTAAFRSNSAAMDWCRALRFKWGVAWAFTCKTRLVWKSSKFKFGDYGGQYVLRPGGGGTHPVSKALRRCQCFHVRRQKPAFGGENPLDLLLNPVASVLSAFSP